MDPRSPAQAPPPRPGSSPDSTRKGREEPAATKPGFHVKGNVYRATQLFFDSQVEGGIESLLRELDPKLRAFLEQQFVPVGWYDVMPAGPLVLAEAKRLGQPLETYLRMRTEFQAEKDISGVYRFLLKIASPQAVALRLPRLVTQVFDFGTAEAHVAGENEVVGVFSGFPAALIPWLSVAFEVYGATALRLAGGRGATGTVTTQKLVQYRDGVQLASLSCTYRWR